MAFPDYCTNELKFRICTNCKNIHYKIYKTLGKCQRQYERVANVCYFFTIKAFINVYYYFGRLTHLCFAALLVPLEY